MSSPFSPVATPADLNTLSDAEIIEGYMDYQSGDPEPGANRGRTYWHGWMNAARDHHERPHTPEAMQLVHEVVDDNRAKAKKNERMNMKSKKNSSQASVMV
jgi:hypothetical protein